MMTGFLISKVLSVLLWCYTYLTMISVPTGDGRKDMVCHKQMLGVLTWSPATPAGRYEEEKPLATGFCQVNQLPLPGQLYLTMVLFARASQVYLCHH